MSNFWNDIHFYVYAFYYFIYLFIYLMEHKNSLQSLCVSQSYHRQSNREFLCQCKPRTCSPPNYIYSSNNQMESKNRENCFIELFSLRFALVFLFAVLIYKRFEKTTKIKHISEIQSQLLANRLYWLLIFPFNARHRGIFMNRKKYNIKYYFVY